MKRTQAPFMQMSKALILDCQVKDMAIKGATMFVVIAPQPSFPKEPARLRDAPQRVRAELLEDRADLRYRALVLRRDGFGDNQKAKMTRTCWGVWISK